MRPATRSKPSSRTGCQATLHLVSCVSGKHSHPTPARSLYTSPWFLKARQHVEAQQSPWFILSAAHGLLHPEQLVAPYNQTLRDMTPLDRRAWANRVLDQLAPHLEDLTHVVIFAGKLYRQHLVPALESRGCSVTAPIAGLGIGQQLAWFKAREGQGR